MSTSPTAKAIASGLDPSYFTRPPRWRLLRRSLIAVICVSALVFFGVYANRGDQTLYSPGAMTSAHAMWDGNNCAWCHEPQPDGSFSHVVTDNACMRCHDGAVHHPNQATLVSIGAEKTAVRSADCTTCHAEHRGHEQLIARGDATCTQCHADLALTTRDGTTPMQPRVTEFAPGEHPPFGRSLTADKSWSAQQQPLRDPTPLKFNHQAHQVHVKPLPGETQNCTKCHEPTADRQGGMDRASIAPVSYNLHCAECHPLDLIQGAGIRVPHESLDVVRPYLAGAITDLARRFRQELDAMPEAARTKELVTIRMVPRPPLAPVKKEVRITPEEWVAKRVSNTTGELKKWYDDVGPTIPGFEKVQSVAEAAAQPTAGGATSPWAEPNVVEFFAAHVQPGIKSQNKCNLCHELTDDPPAVERLRQAAGPPMHALVADRMRSVLPALSAPAATAPATAPQTPTTRPAPAGSPLEILPTGYADGPRHWFVHSKFDHRAHRLISCTDCHAGAESSVLTSDVLMPPMESCVTCHVPRQPTTAGAGANCHLCHDYHDRSHERTVNGWLRGADLLKSSPPPASATRPAVSAGH